MNQIVKITDVCSFQGGTQPPKSVWKKNQVDGYIRMLQIRDFTQPEKNNVEYIPYKKTLKTCKSDDILIGRYGASVGKICTGLSGAYNVALVKIIPDKNKINRDYLLHLLKGNSFQNFILNVGSRAAQAGFNKDDLDGFTFSLPPLEQQKKIAAILDAADTYRQKTKALIKKYDELTQSLFLDMFGDPVSNPRKLPVKPLGELCEFYSGRAWKKAELGGHGYKLVRISNLHKQHFPYWFYEGEMIEKHKVENGDLLFSWAGVQASIDSYIYKGETAMINQHIYNIKPRHKISKLFLYHLLQLHLDNLRGSLGGGVGQFHLKKADITGIKIIIPDDLTMNNYLSSLASLNKQKEQALASLAQAEDLFNSLLQRAFKGELTS